MAYDSKYSGAQTEALLDKVNRNECGVSEVQVGGEQPTDDTTEIWIDESEETDEQGNILTIDTEMSDTSTNAVQNKVIKAYVDSLIIQTLNTAV